MKKILALLVCVFISAEVFAKEIKIGGRLIGGVDFTDSVTVPSLGVNAYVNYPLDFIFKGLGVQPEISIVNRTSEFTIPVISWLGWNETEKVDYLTLELPALATYTIQIADDFAIVPESGLQFNILMEDVESSDRLHCLFILGSRAEYSLGPGAIVGGFRFFRSLTKVMDTHFMGVDFHAGYQMKIKF